ncbi:MAG: 8-amino-7-oxononanoate synthase [Gammaproteobacteria bacterium]|nr:8-amino-7-oxononanoate synthase [Gammaproteobacteria bacterium]
MLSRHLTDRLNQQRLKDRWRQEITIDSPQGIEVSRLGRSLVNFSSNDYLSLANDPLMIKAMHQAIDKYGCGSGASHLISGHLASHQALEETLVDWLQCEAITLFSSGYQANLAVLTTLVGKGDLIVQDKLNHASLIDAGLMSQAANKRYRHCDYQSLLQQLKGDFNSKMIVSDGVFSMDGDAVNLTELMSIASEEKASVYIDDAHGIGVLGHEGSGTLAHYNVKPVDNVIMMGTMGKALGVAGAFVASSQLVADALKQFARPYIYTTAMPPANAQVANEAVNIIRKTPERTEKLRHNIVQFKQLALHYNIQLMPSDTAIQPVLVGTERKCLSVAKELELQGFLVGAIRPPTVPENTCRLRITLSSHHSVTMIQNLVSSLSEILDKHDEKDNKVMNK